MGKLYTIQGSLPQMTKKAELPGFQIPGPRPSGSYDVEGCDVTTLDL